MRITNALLYRLSYRGAPRRRGNTRKKRTQGTVRDRGTRRRYPLIRPLCSQSENCLCRTPYSPAWWQARRSGRPRFRAQLEALDLAGRGLRQLAAEFKPARILEDSELLPTVVLERLRQSVELCAMYWHFLLFIWLALLFLLAGWANDFIDLCRQLLT